MLKYRFKNCMKLLYPDGISNGVNGQTQLDDLAKTFAMGYVEGAVALDSMDNVMKEAAELARAGWSADDSWKWW